MEAKNLRIGNWVTKQYILDEDGKVFDSQIEITDFMYDEFNEVHEIPLTEEQLIKFGFDKRGYDGNKFDKDIFKIDVRCMIWGIGSCSGTGTIKGYVHEIQNLYFALTNKELTIKP